MTVPSELLTDEIVGAAIARVPLMFVMRTGPPVLAKPGYSVSSVIGTPKSMVMVADVVATGPWVQKKMRSPAGSVNPVSVSRLTGVLPTPQLSCAYAAFDRPKMSIANTSKRVFMFSIVWFSLLKRHRVMHHPGLATFIRQVAFAPLQRALCDSHDAGASSFGSGIAALS